MSASVGGVESIRLAVFGRAGNAGRFECTVLGHAESVGDLPPRVPCGAGFGDEFGTSGRQVQHLLLDTAEGREWVVLHAPRVTWVTQQQLTRN